MKTRPEVGNFSRNRSRVSMSPEATSISGEFVQTGIVADNEQGVCVAGRPP